MTGNELANKVLVEQSAMRSADLLMSNLGLVIYALRAYDTPRPEARRITRSSCACEVDDDDAFIRWCAPHAALRTALETFVKAEGDWLAQKSGMPPGTFDDPLSDAYKQAQEALADVSVRSPRGTKP